MNSLYEYVMILEEDDRKKRLKKSMKSKKNKNA